MESRPVPFDTFMNGSLSVSIPLTLLVPAGYRFTPADAPETYSFWMTPDSAAAFRKAKDLPVLKGFMYGKVSLDVAYDSRTGVFVGAEDQEAAAAQAGMDVSFQKASSHGHALLFIEGTERKTQRKLYALYVALNVATNTVYIVYMPPKDEPSVAVCYCKAFKAKLLESK